MKILLETYRDILKLAKEKKYDEIYEKYGSDAYFMFAKEKHKREDINTLEKNNEFRKMYEKYGNSEKYAKKAYNRHIKKLAKEGKYLEIQSIYEFDHYNKYKYKMYKSDLLEETYNFRANYLLIKKIVVSNIIRLAAISSSVIVLAGALLESTRSSFYQNIVAENQETLDIYNKKIANYADEINALNLDNDLDVVMKVMNDMWSDASYGLPENDYSQLFRLAFTGENGVGVCRHLADDFAARLNAINPDYQAELMSVYIYDAYARNNIERHIIESNETVVSDNSNENNENDVVEEKDDILANHAVCIFKPLGKDYYLVVDPTNPAIGVINNGKIYMFTSKDDECLKYKFISQLAITNSDPFKIEAKFIKSNIFSLSDEELEQLEQEWGIAAQNESLERITNNNTKRL